MKILILFTLFFSIASISKDLFKSISIDDLDSLMKSKSKRIYIYDANVESTREHVGIIPQAQLLDDSSKYDIEKTLPTDKKSSLVFYCANQMCTSSHQAAIRAIQAGYSEVSVLKDGIYGWKKAGKTLASLKNSRNPQSTSISNSPKTAQSIEPSAADQMAKKNLAFIVDVREEEERHEIVPSSKWIPMSKTGDSKAWSDFKNQIPSHKTVIFYCAAGFRSKKIAEKLAAEGYTTYYFKGVDQWKSSGLPTSVGPSK